MSPTELPESAGSRGLGPAISEGYGGAMQSLGQTWLAGLPTMVAMLVSQVVLIAGVVVVAIAAGGLVVGLLSPNTSAAGLVGVLAGGLLAYLAGATVLLLLMFAAIAPPFQALYRAHARNVLHGQTLGVGDGLKGAFGSHGLNVFLAVAMTAESLGYLFLFLPGVLVSAATAFVVPAVVVHELPLGAAILRSVRHFLRAPVWHFGLALVDAMVLFGLSSLLPFISPLLTLPLSTQLHLRAYLEAFPLRADPPADAPAPAPAAVPTA